MFLVTGKKGIRLKWKLLFSITNIDFLPAWSYKSESQSICIIYWLCTLRLKSCMRSIINFSEPILSLSRRPTFRLIDLYRKKLFPSFVSLFVWCFLTDFNSETIHWKILYFLHEVRKSIKSEIWLTRRFFLVYSRSFPKRPYSRVRDLLGIFTLNFFPYF